MIVAAIRYYRNGPQMLERVLESLCGRVQGVALLDGPYEGVSRDIRPRRGEQAVIQRYARSGRIEVVNIPATVWPSEPVKMTVAARVCKGEWPNAEWLLGIDTDEELISAIDVPPVGQLGVALIVDPPWQQRKLCRITPRGCIDRERRGESCDCPPLANATMIRLHRLTHDLTWGPSHFEVSTGGLRYATPHGLPDAGHCMVIQHHGTHKRGAMRRYNDVIRDQVEMTSDVDASWRPMWSYASRPGTVYTTLAGEAERAG